MVKRGTVVIAAVGAAAAAGIGLALAAKAAAPAPLALSIGTPGGPLSASVSNGANLNFFVGGGVVGDPVQLYFNQTGSTKIVDSALLNQGTLYSGFSNGSFLFQESHWPSGGTYTVFAVDPVTGQVSNTVTVTVS